MRNDVFFNQRLRRKNRSSSNRSRIFSSESPVSLIDENIISQEPLNSNNLFVNLTHWQLQICLQLYGVTELFTDKLPDMH